MQKLDAAHAAFIQGGVSINAASRAGERLPVLSRAQGCRLAGERVRLVFCAVKSRALLDAVAATHAIAAVFSEPASHRTIQLKSADARVLPGGPEDAELAARYARAFAAALEPLGYPGSWVQAALACEGALAVVEFTPGAAYVQTPGPRAGEPLR